MLVDLYQHRCGGLFAFVFFFERVGLLWLTAFG